MRELSFKLDIRSPERRRIAVSLDADVVSLPTKGTPEGVEFFLPVWTPGSYLVREFSRHLGPVEARDPASGCRLPCRKVRKNRYRVDLPAGLASLRLEYQVYAHELTVRTADVTPEHAFWNNTCVLLWPVGDTDLRARIEVLLPPAWDLATALPRQHAEPGRFVLQAADMDTVFDSPCLAGTFTRIDWRVRGVPHAIVLDGLGPVRPPDSLATDLTRLVELAADLFGEIPYPSFLFLGLFSDGGSHGGLEHANSTTLLAARADLRSDKGYREFLGLAAHELFHAWNVKRMRPVEFWRYDYEAENHTSMLWLAEGFTAYYDDLLCRRGGLLSVTDYLAILAKNLSNLWQGAGRFRQSLGEASFDAWIRLYRPDEHTRNSTQNYYGNGALAALVLDFSLRRGGDHDLDDVLRSLYRSTYLQGRGYHRADVEQCLADAGGPTMPELLRQLVDGALDPDFRSLFADFGIEVVQDDLDRPHLGLAFQSDKMVVSAVDDHGPGLASGIAPGDEVLAFDGVRVASDQWRDVLQSVAKVDRPLRVLIASRGLVIERLLRPVAAPVGTVSLRLAADAPPESLRRRADWLGIEVEAPREA